MEDIVNKSDRVNKKLKLFYDAKQKSKLRLQTLFAFADSSSEKEQIKVFLESERLIFDLFFEYWKSTIDRIKKCKEFAEKYEKGGPSFSNFREGLDWLKCISFLFKMIRYFEGRYTKMEHVAIIESSFRILLAEGNHPKLKGEGMMLLLQWLAFDVPTEPSSSASQRSKSHSISGSDSGEFVSQEPMLRVHGEGTALNLFKNFIVKARIMPLLSEASEVPMQVTDILIPAHPALSRTHLALSSLHDFLYILTWHESLLCHQLEYIFDVFVQHYLNVWMPAQENILTDLASLKSIEPVGLVSDAYRLFLSFFAFWSVRHSGAVSLLTTHFPFIRFCSLSPNYDVYLTAWIAYIKGDTDKGSDVFLLPSPAILELFPNFSGLVWSTVISSTVSSSSLSYPGPNSILSNISGSSTVFLTSQAHRVSSTPSLPLPLPIFPPSSFVLEDLLFSSAEHLALLHTVLFYCLQSSLKVRDARDAEIFIIIVAAFKSWLLQQPSKIPFISHLEPSRSPDLRALYIDRINHHVKWYCRAVSYIFHAKSTSASSKDQLACYDAVLEFLTLLASQTYYTLREDAWDAIMDSLVQSCETFLTLPNKYALISTPLIAEQFAQHLGKTIFTVWIFCESHKERDWHKLKAALCQCTRWPLLVFEWAKTMELLTHWVVKTVFVEVRQELEGGHFRTELFKHRKSNSVIEQQQKRRTDGPPRKVMESSGTFEVGSPKIFSPGTESPRLQNSDDLSDSSSEIEDFLCVSYYDVIERMNSEDVNWECLVSGDWKNDSTGSLTQSMDLMEEKSWDPFFLWLNMSRVLGNINEIERPEIFVTVIETLASILDTFLEIRYHQPYYTTNVPPCLEFFDWFIEATLHSELFAAGKAIAHGALGRMICRRPDFAIGSDSFAEYYAAYLSGLSSLQFDTLSQTIEHGSKLFYFDCPDSEICIPFILSSIANLISENENKFLYAKIPIRIRKRIIPLLTSMASVSETCAKVVLSSGDVGNTLFSFTNDQVDSIFKSLLLLEEVIAAESKPALEMRARILYACTIAMMGRLECSQEDMDRLEFMTTLCGLLSTSHMSIADVAINCLYSLAQVTHAEHLVLRVLKAIVTAIEEHLNIIFASHGNRDIQVVQWKILTKLFSLVVEWSMRVSPSLIFGLSDRESMSPLGTSVFKVLQTASILSLDCLQRLRSQPTPASNSNTKKSSSSTRKSTPIVGGSDLYLHGHVNPSDANEPNEKGKAGYGVSVSEEMVTSPMLGASASVGHVASIQFAQTHTPISMTEQDMFFTIAHETVHFTLLQLWSYIGQYPGPFGPSLLGSSVSEPSLESEESPWLVLSVGDSLVVSIYEKLDAPEVAHVTARDASGNHTWQFRIPPISPSSVQADGSNVTDLKESSSEHGNKSFISLMDFANCSTLEESEGPPDYLKELLELVAKAHPECAIESKVFSQSVTDADLIAETVVPKTEPRVEPLSIASRVSPLSMSSTSSSRWSLTVARSLLRFFGWYDYVRPESSASSTDARPLLTELKVPPSPASISAKPSTQHSLTTPPIGLLPPSPALVRDMKLLDKRLSRESLKVAILYVADGQESESAILSNQSGSLAYRSFVNSLGWEVDLRSHLGYTGGLERSNLPEQSTCIENEGSFSKATYYCTLTLEMIFHDATRMPNDPLDIKQVKKKRHIGNDHIHIIFNEHPKEYRADTIRGDFGNVIIIVNPLKSCSGLFGIRILCRDEKISLFGPLLDGMVVSERILGPAVRATALLAHKSILHSLPTPYHHPYHYRAEDIKSLIKRHKNASANYQELISYSAQSTLPV